MSDAPTTYSLGARRHIYEALKRAGYSPTKSLEITISYFRGDQQAIYVVGHALAFKAQGGAK